MRDKDALAKLNEVKAAQEELRSIIAQLQIDVHTIKAQQYLRDWSINGK
jgi:hypothetical protein